MIIFIYGEDTYRAGQKFIELLDGFAKKYDPSGLNTTRFRAGAEIGAVQSAAATPPFLAQKRLVALENIWGKKIRKDDAEPWIDVLRLVPVTTVLICREDSEKHIVITKFPDNKKNILHYTFPPMTLAEAASWIEREAQTRGGMIERPAIQELLARVGTDSGMLAQEVGKLVAYAHGRAIRKDDVVALVVAGIESDIFATMDALSSRDTKRATELLHGRLRAGDDEFYLFSMLARETRIMLMVKDAPDAANRSALSSRLKLHPFVVGKAVTHAARFTLAELKGLHDKLFALDWGIKQGKMTPILALDLFVASV